MQGQSRVWKHLNVKKDKKEELRETEGYIQCWGQEKEQIQEGKQN